MTEFASEREVQLGACPVCGQTTQYVHASLLEVRVSCYCSPTSSINVLAETEAEALARWRQISTVTPMPSWNPVRYVPPPVGRLLVTVLHDGKPVVSIAKWDGQAWMPATPVIAWAPLPEAWS